MDDPTAGAAPMRGATAEADARSKLAEIEAEQARAGRELEPDARLIYGVWGAAWLVGSCCSGPPHARPDRWRSRWGLPASCPRAVWRRR